MMAICEWLALAVAGNTAPPIRASAVPKAAALKRRLQRLVTKSLSITYLTATGDQSCDVAPSREDTSDTSPSVG